MAKSARRKPDRFSVKSGLENALTGLFVALIVSIIVYLTPIARFGSDLTQKILLATSAEGGPAGAVQAGSNPALPVNWVFVDLGGRFCADNDGGAHCPPARVRTDRVALARLLAGIRSHRPRLIVLDVATEPAGPEEDTALIALLTQSGSPILLSWSPSGEDIYNRDGGQASLRYDAEKFLCDPDACAFPDARYFPSLRRISDGTARWLTSEFLLVSARGNRAPVVPSISRAAALVARSSPNAPWALVERAMAGKAQDQGCAQMTAPACAEAFRKTQRVFSFAPVQEGSSRTESIQWDSTSFTHYTPDIDADVVTMPRAMRDAVVVVGDSRASAGDRTWSAAGAVSGAELILNDTRQFMIAPPRPTPGIFQYLWSESPFLLMGFCAVFLITARFGEQETVPPKTIVPAIRGFGRALALLVLATAGIALLYAVFLWLTGISPGAPPDIATPFVGMLLEAFLDLMHKLTTFVELVVKRLIECILARLGKVP